MPQIPFRYCKLQSVIFKKKGSSDLWVDTDECDEIFDQCHKAGPRFDRDSSKTWQDSGKIKQLNWKSRLVAFSSGLT